MNGVSVFWRTDEKPKPLEAEPPERFLTLADKPLAARLYCLTGPKQGAVFDVLQEEWPIGR